MKTQKMNRRRRFRSVHQRAWWVSGQTLLQTLTTIFVVALFLSEGTLKDFSNTIEEQLNSQAYDVSATGTVPKGNENDGNPSMPNITKEGNAGMTLKANPKGPKVHGSSLNLEDFRKKTEEKALEDALKKRAAIELQKSRRRSVSSSRRKPKVDWEDLNLEEEVLVNTTKKASPGHFRGVKKTLDNAHLFKVDNITHLSFMIYRLVKTHKISSIVDIPCTWSMFWMPEVVQRLEFEVPGFRYRCIVPEDKEKVEALYRFRELSSATVVSDPAVWASQVPKADLAITWHSLGFLAPKKSWQLLQALHKSGTKYVAVPNYPGLHHNPGVATKHGRINVRRAPYRFDEALRVINNVSVHRAVRKQLLFYNVEGIRLGVL